MPSDLSDSNAQPLNLHYREDGNPNGPPVLLVHGDADDIVPYSSLAIAETALKDVGVVVEAVSRPGLGHGIDNEGFGFAVAHTMQAFGVEMG